MKRPYRCRNSLGIQVGLFAVVSSALAACAVSAGDEREVGGGAASLYTATGNFLWNGNVAGKAAQVPVCFTVRPRIDTTGQTICPLQTDATKDCEGQTSFQFVPFNPTALRSLIRQAVTDAWQRAGNIELYGWGDCPIDAATNKHKDSQLTHTIVIQFSRPYDPPANQACTTTDQCQATTLNSQCTNGVCTAGAVDWSTIGMTTTDTVMQYNWKALQDGTDTFNLVHEFGHAIGFDHEWDRPDWNFGIPASCGNVVPVPGTYWTSLPDQQSKMQYCNPDASGRTDRFLSAGDILGMQKAYGRKYQGSLVGYGGMCADIQGGSLANGAPVIAYPCRGQANDTFLSPNDNLLHLATTQNKCLTVAYGVAPNPVVSWDCGNFANQQYVLGDVFVAGAEWRAMGNLCATAVSGKIQMQACDNSAAQRWLVQQPNAFLRYDMIQSVGTGLCVASATPTGAVGQELVLVGCSIFDTAQRFTFPGGGLLRSANNSGLCLNVVGGQPVAGSRIAFGNSCNPSAPPQSAQFYLRGRVKSLNACMQIMGTGATGDIVSQQPCDLFNTTTQIWDYYAF